MLRPVLDAFWSEAVWLPPNTTWADVAPGADKAVTYTDHRHVWLPVPMALVLIATRFVLEKYVYAPFGRSLGIKDARNRKASPNPKLEAAYRANPASKKLCDLAKQLDISERQVARWWRLRRSQDKPSTLVKFCEDMWRCTYFVCNVCFGVVVLWDKDWLWDADYCYIGYPNQGITNDVWWYFMISSAFYWSLALTLFWDVPRKDFWQMFVHHAAAIFLSSFAWVCNFHRIGTLVVVSHECSEIFLEATKAAKHAGYQKLCDCLFGAFTLIWIFTRLGFYPFQLIWSVMFRAPLFIPMFPATYMFICLHFVLLGLHVMWTWTIMQIAYNSIKTGQMEGDIRSSCSEVSDSTHYSDHTPGQTNNGNNKQWRNELDTFLYDWPEVAYDRELWKPRGQRVP